MIGNFDFDREFRPLRSRPCWGVRFDRQLNLSMNFGKPSLEIREPRAVENGSARVRRLFRSRRVTVRGQWWLWIYYSRWQVFLDDDLLAKSNSSLKKIEQMTKVLDGQKLVDVQVTPNTGETTFAFDLGCVLRCQSLERNAKQELWLLYKPDGSVLFVNGTGNVEVNPANGEGG